MADSSWARIQIGGVVSRKTLEEIFDGEDLERMVEEDGYLVLENDDKSWGQWDEEGMLVEARIAFNRETAMDNYWPASVRLFRPSLGDFEYTCGDNNTEQGKGAMVRLDHIREMLTKLGPRFAVWFTKTYPVIPPLEPIQIIEDAEEEEKTEEEEADAS